MKIVINTLEQIGGVEIYPIISLLIFFSLFAAVAYLSLTAKKDYIDEMKHMPFSDDEMQKSDNHNLEQ
jgi:cytochrome c oxidase cbb3-type subunit 4